jgi:hypothetical protein
MKSFLPAFDIVRLGDGNYVAPTSTNMDTTLCLRFTRSPAVHLKIVPK